MIGVYVRVSSRQQSTESQEPDLVRWLKAQGADIEPEVTWYRDVSTGKNTARPGFENLVNAMRLRAVNTIVVWRLDRLGRSARDLSALIAEMTDRGINFVSLREGIDLSTPAGRMMAHVVASMAQYETEIRAERVAAGIQAKRAKGEKWGGSRSGRRTKKTEGKQALARKLRDTGESVASIARMLGISRPTVYSLLET